MTDPLPPKAIWNPVPKLWSSYGCLPLWPTTGTLQWPPSPISPSLPTHRVTACLGPASHLTGPHILLLILHHPSYTYLLGSPELGLEKEGKPLCSWTVYRMIPEVTVIFEAPTIQLTRFLGKCLPLIERSLCVMRELRSNVILNCRWTNGHRLRITRR